MTETQYVPPQDETVAENVPVNESLSTKQEGGSAAVVQNAECSPKHYKEVSVVAATVAADLKIVTEVANQITLTVMNAKVVATRAGEEGRAFKPITEFVSTLAQETSQVVSQINSLVLKVSQTAMQETFTRRMADAVTKAYMMHQSGNQGYEQLKTWQHGYQEQQRTKHTELAEDVRRLLSALDAIEYQVRSAQCISSNCRIEAANVQSYRQDFETVAASVEAAAQKMREQVSKSRQQLEFCLNSQLDVGI